VKSVLYGYNTKGKNQVVFDSIKNYDAIMCNYNIFKPKYTLITSAHYQYNNIDKNSLSIGFFSLSRPHIFSSSWSIKFIGGTTVTNTTFSELVKMVKEDCGQFQEGHGDFYGKDLAWSYSPAPTQEELDRRNIRSILSDYEDYSEATKIIFNKIYNIEPKDLLGRDDSSDQKALELYNKIKQEGLHPDVQTQIDFEKAEYQRKIESGEIILKTTEEKLREKGNDEDKIKIAVEAKGEKYIGPK